MNIGDAKTSRVALHNTFAKRVISIVARIPSGRVLTYREVARRAGNPKAARAVGAILAKNYDPTVPCHRVICSGGALGGYNRGAFLKRKRLLKEGVRLSRSF